MIYLRYLLFGLLVLGGTGTTQNGVIAADEDCPDMSQPDLNLDSLPQDQFVSILTDPCRYDKFEKPNTTTPLDIDVQINLYHLEASQSQFTVYMTMQYIYFDNHLIYKTFSPNRKVMVGDESLKDKIWAPNIYIRDRNDITVTGIQEKDVLVSIKPTGEVIYTCKTVVAFYCLLHLEKFPFDSQKCTLQLSDWTYSNNSLTWRNESKLKYSENLHFTEYVLDEASLTLTENNLTRGYASDDSYSELTITLKFHRDIGYYLFDFFLPSFLLVFTAWVTFWLQADAGPPRATLGASTVIAFVTLHLGVAKDIPKVSYTKASDIWFLGISFFIFTSLAEFAFVNVIWRRKKTIELKKSKSKYILKSAVMPSIARSDLRKYESTQTLWTPSSESLTTLSAQSLPRDQQYNEIYRNVENGKQNETRNGHSTVSIPEDVMRNQNQWKTMTPHEVAIWVDRKARIVFPIVFLIFNVFYWIFVYLG